MVMDTLSIAPIIALTKNTLDGLNLSAIDNSANRNVPRIKPNCTAEVMDANASVGKSQSVCKSLRIAFPANHREVPANCAKMIVGKMRFEILLITPFA